MLQLATQRLKYRINGKYLQIGYYEKGKWINVMHVGTADSLVCRLKHLDESTNQINEHTKKIREELFKLSSKHT